MKRIFLIALLLVSTACKEEGAEKKAVKTNLLVMSSNIAYTDDHNNDQFSWPNRRPAYFAMLEDISPDIIGMQEATPRGVDDDGVGRPNQVKDILDRFPEYDVYRMYPEEIMPDGKPVHMKHGSVAIWYKKDRFTLMDKGIFWLSKTPDTPLNSDNPFGCMDWHPRACVWVHLKDNESSKEIFLFNTHFPYDPANYDANGNRVYNTIARRKSAELIVSRIKSIAGPNAIVFVTGDMNSAYENTKLYTYIAPETGVQETHAVCESLAPFGYLWKARTEAPITDDFNSNNRFDDTKATQKIDHIFYRNATPLEFKTINTPYLETKYLSDHWPIICNFEI